jgi:Ca2+-binding EF-hand superfamily protein
VHLHSKNINLNKIIGSLKEEKLNQVEFINFISFIQKDITQEEILLLYKEVAAKDGFVYLNDFTQFLLKHRIRLTGIDLSKHEMECEDDDSDMKASKPVIAVFTRLKLTMDSKGMDVSKVLQSMKFSKSDVIPPNTFAKIIHNFDDSVSERELEFLYREFNTSNGSPITFDDVTRGLCKIAEIVPMEEEK